MALSGSIQEEIVYNKLRDSLKENKVKQTVLMYGWKDNGSRDRTQKEFDFLIVSQPSQTIIHIEVKRTCCDSQFRSASTQLNNGLQMFEKCIPFPGIVKWKYVKVVYFGFAANKQPFQNKCLHCKNFIIGPSTDFNLWWKEVTKCHPQETKLNFKEQPDDTYLNVLSFLLHQMYKQNDFAILKQLLQETLEKQFSSHTLMFWSKEQNKNLKVALTSGFETR